LKGTGQVSHTWLESNVSLLARAIRGNTPDGVQQFVSYQRGLGTSIFTKILGQAFGTGFHEIVRDSYLSIAANWTPQDEIYLFGFSRGAYIVRVLANLICDHGLISRYGREGNNPTVVKKDAVSTGKSLTPAGTKTPPRWLAILKETNHLHHGVGITFLGVWDTVRSIGPISYWCTRKYYSADLPKTVQYAFHA